MAKNVVAKTWSLPSFNGSRPSTGVQSVPGKVTGLSTTGKTDTSVSLSWTAVSGADTYSVYVDGTETKTGVTGTTTTVTGLAAATTYNTPGFQVSAVNTAGEGTLSDAVTETTNAASAFQLASGHYEPEHIGIEFIQPRPDAERTIYSRWSYAYPGLEMEAQCVILGGSYPYKYEITARSGTANVATATIGETRSYSVGREWYGSANMRDYGVFRWTPDAGDDGNTYSFTIKATGQDGQTATRTFTGTVSTSKFIFVDLDVATSGDGTAASPFKDTTDGWWDDGNHGDKFVYYRGRTGTYAPFPTSFWTSAKPRVHLRYPGDDRYKWDGTQKDYLFDDLDDVWVSGMYVEQGPGTTVSQARFFEAGTSTADFDRPMFWDNYFYDGRVGSSGNDNNGWIVCLSSGSTHQHIAIVGNTFDTSNSSSNGFYVYDFFDVQKYVVEHNVVKNWTGDAAFHPKSDNRNLSIRANDMWEGNQVGGKSLTGTYFANDNNQDWEVCWNFAKDSGEVPTKFGVSSYSSDYTPGYSYRNTLLAAGSAAANEIISRTADNSETFRIVGNVMASQDAPHRIQGTGTGPVAVSDATAEGELTNSTFDNTWYDSDTQTEVNTTSGLLQNDGTSVRGTYGAEIE